MRISILNQKGGVGKTTIATNLVYGLSRHDRTLLIDLDPQAHASLIYVKKPPERTVSDIFESRRNDIRDAVTSAMLQEQVVENLDLVPSTIKLASTSERLVSQHYREQRLHDNLSRLDEDYAWIIMDCPPNLGIITVNAIYAADVVLIPTIYGRYALDGISDLLDTIEEIKREGGADSWRILRNNYDVRTSSTNRYFEDELQDVQAHVMSTRIRTCQAINQAQIAGQPVAVFDPKGHGAEDYETLVKEISQWRI